MPKKEFNRPAASAASIDAPETPGMTAATDRTPRYNPDFERQMRLAEDIVHEDLEIFRTLAK